jgi:hypothetical protein
MKKPIYRSQQTSQPREIYVPQPMATSSHYKQPKVRPLLALRLVSIIGISYQRTS